MNQRFIIAPIVIFFIYIFSLSSLAFSVSQKVIDKEDNKEEQQQNLEHQTKETYCLAKVIKIISDIEEELPGGNKQRTQQLLIKILDGPEKNKERATTNVIPDNPAFAIIGEAGKKYLVAKIEDLSTGIEDYYVSDYYREPVIWFLSLIFIGVILVVGGFKGVRSLVSLIITIALIAFVLIPSIVKGVNPLLMAIIISFFSTALTMMLVAGINVKSLASTLGTVIGITFSGILATLVIQCAPLTGLASTEAMILWGNQIYNINFKGLLACGMIVSCLGAIMDVAISVASSIQEIELANPSYKIKELFSSGMNIGKDIMGTMINTLVLAYTGMGLPLLILISHEKNPSKFLNLELVVSEFAAAIAGSIGLILSIPITALIMSFLVYKKPYLK